MLKLEHLVLLLTQISYLGLGKALCNINRQYWYYNLGACSKFIYFTCRVVDWVPEAQEN